MKVAIIHDWFITIGGAEKVVKQIIAVFPEADVFSLFNHLDKQNKHNLLPGKEVKTSFLQKFPFGKKYYKIMLPFFKNAVESFDFSGYDLIISSSHSFVKGVRKANPAQIHISYCHTPARYLYDMRRLYLAQIGNKFLKKRLNRYLNKLQKWDLSTSSSIDYYVANSQFIANRIKAVYKRESTIIHPPVDVKKFAPSSDGNQTRGDFFLVVSRLVTYKRVDLIINTFKELPHLKLVIVGKGPKTKAFKKMATPNIEFLGYQSDEEIITLMRKTRALIQAAVEDFGITTVESMACGTPVIAYRNGGYLDTVIHEKTGIFFNHQSVKSLKISINEFIDKEHNFIPSHLVEHAGQFSEDRFKVEFLNFINEKVK